MDVPDAVLGKVVLVSTASVFLVFVTWVNTYPFIDDESELYQYVPEPTWGLAASAAWGLAFIGGSWLSLSTTCDHICDYCHHLL